MSYEKEPTPVLLIQDPDKYEEDAQYTLRQTLGLRPIFVPEKTPDGSMAAHPDPRPCPSWCWAAEQGDQHEASESFYRLHRSEHIAIAATRYRSHWVDYENGGVARAVLEVSLEQPGSQRPGIKLNRRGHNGKRPVLDHLLNLSIADARDLVTVLSHLIGQVDDAEPARRASQLKYG